MSLPPPSTALMLKRIGESGASIMLAAPNASGSILLSYLCNSDFKMPVNLASLECRSKNTMMATMTSKGFDFAFNHVAFLATS